MGRPLTIVLVGLVCAGTVSCHASYPFDPTYVAPVAGVSVHYNTVLGDVVVGSTFTFSAYAVDSDGGYERVTAQATWSSSDSQVVQALGVAFGQGSFRAAGPGVATIIGTYQGFTDSLSIRVLAAPPPFPHLQIFSSLSLLGPRLIGTQLPVQARLRHSASQWDDVTAIATWTSSDPRIATVDGGVITAVGVGTVEITASYNGFTDRYAFSIPPRS